MFKIKIIAKFHLILSNSRHKNQCVIFVQSLRVSSCCAIALGTGDSARARNTVAVRLRKIDMLSIKVFVATAKEDCFFDVAVSIRAPR